LSADPIGIEDGVNVYGYCRGSPILYEDTDGRKSKNIKGSGLKVNQLEPLQMTTYSVRRIPKTLIPFVSKKISTQKDYFFEDIYYHTENRNYNFIDDEKSLIIPKNVQQPLYVILKGIQINPGNIGTGKPSDPLKYIVPYTTDCGLATTKALNQGGYRVGGNGRSGYLTKSQLFTKNDLETNKTRDTFSDRTFLTRKQGKVLLNIIDENLYLGKPIAVGIDTHVGGAKGQEPDGVTDHWAFIMGRDYDDKGRVFYYLGDNATTGIEEDGNNYKQFQKLYIDPETYTLFKPKKYSNQDYTNQPYTIMNIHEVTPIK